MLKRLPPRERFEQAVSTYDPLLREVWIEAIDDIRSNIVLRRVVERGGINGAITPLRLDEAAFRPLDRAMPKRSKGRYRGSRLDAGASRYFGTSVRYPVRCP